MGGREPRTAGTTHQVLLFSAHTSHHDTRTAPDLPTPAPSSHGRRAASPWWASPCAGPPAQGRPPRPAVSTLHRDGGAPLSSEAALPPLCRSVSLPPGTRRPVLSRALPSVAPSPKTCLTLEAGARGRGGGGRTERPPRTWRESKGSWCQAASSRSQPAVPPQPSPARC